MMSMTFKVAEHLIDGQQWPDIRAVGDADGKLIGYDVTFGPVIPPERMHLQAQPGGPGFTIESLLAIAGHRLRSLNAEVPCAWNESAIDKIQRALEALHDRTRDRRARGVEGTPRA
jgi:hypothetical protein